MRDHFRSTVCAAFALAAAFCCVWPNASRADANAEIEVGRALYMQKGCYECHGIFGQGSIATGPALAPHPIPLSAMQAYVRNPKGQMPVFSAKILSDADIAHIHAYLASVPQNPPADSVALLSNGTSSASRPRGEASAASVAMPSERGPSIYAANCAACHGQSGEGGIGPALIGISSRFQISEIEARIREPSGIMPRLFPAPLNAGDVREVARYVASLKRSQ